VRVVAYDPARVVTIEGVLNFQMLIEFNPDERIENVSVGDSLGWQVTPNRKASLLFVKPIEPDAHTNMTVVTTLRRYLFELKVRARVRRTARPPVYALRFDYPAPFEATVVAPPPAPPAPEVRNAAYSYQGSAQLVPSRVFDDGASTYFAFAGATDFPAIFVLGADGKESLADVAPRDGYFVVDQVVRGFVLRQGAQSTRIVNDAWREATPGPLSPKPAAKRRSRAR